jgi:hypothetical protein
MQGVLVLMLALIGSTSGYHLRLPSTWTRAPVSTRARVLVSMGLLDDIADKARYLPIQQMIDQRVASVSQILMKTGGPLTAQEAFAQFDAWKEEIGDDPDKFDAVAREHSEDDSPGNRITATRLKQLPRQVDDIVFVKDPKPGVYGPIPTSKGLYLIYLHFCGDPTKMGGLAIFDPPNSVKSKLNAAFGDKSE